MPAPLNQVTSFNWGGDKEFLMKTNAKLGAMAVGHRALENDEGYELEESQSP